MQREEGAPKGFWARHKTQAVLRLLRGEDIDVGNRELGWTPRCCPRGATPSRRLGNRGASRNRQGNAYAVLAFLSPGAGRRADSG